MKISIITPAYNAATYVGATIESVQAQTVAGWEMVVVDDGSRDDTAEVVACYSLKDPRIRLVRQDNQGVSVARNRALAEMAPDSDLVTFLDADDLWEPDALETLIGAFERLPGAVGAHAVGRYIDSAGEPVRAGDLEEWMSARWSVTERGVVRLRDEEPTGFASLVYLNTLTIGSALFRREAVEKAGAFDTTLRAYEDWDLWLRIAAQGDLAFTNRVIFNYRQHGASASNKQSMFAEDERKARLKSLTLPGLTAEQRSIVRRGYRAYERLLFHKRCAWATDDLKRGRLVGAAKQFRHAAVNGVRSLCG